MQILMLYALFYLQKAENKYILHFKDILLFVSLFFKRGVDK